MQKQLERKHFFFPAGDLQGSGQRQTYIRKSLEGLLFLL